MQLYVTVNNYHFNLKWRPLFIEGSISNLSILFVRNLWEINPIFLQISNLGIVLLYYIIMLFNCTISIVLAIKYNIFDCYLLDQNVIPFLSQKNFCGCNYYTLILPQYATSVAVYILLNF